MYKRTYSEELCSSAQSFAVDLHAFLNCMNKTDVPSLADMADPDLLLVLDQFASNGVYKEPDSIEFECIPVARALYPSASLLNHSCIPNVLLRFTQILHLYI